MEENEISIETYCENGIIYIGSNINIHFTESSTEEIVEMSKKVLDRKLKLLPTLTDEEEIEECNFFIDECRRYLSMYQLVENIEENGAERNV